MIMVRRDSEARRGSRCELLKCGCGCGCAGSVDRPSTPRLAKSTDHASVSSSSEMGR